MLNLLFIQGVQGVIETSDIGRMIEKGISHIGRPLNDVNIAIENVGYLATSPERD